MSNDFGSLDAKPKIKDGKYQIVPASGGEPVGMTRATNVAGVLPDRYNLERWSERIVALGMARRPDLVGMAATLDPETDKRQLGDVANAAKTAGGDKASANLGTALHKATELADLGLEVPEVFAERIAEYQRALDAAGITVCPDAIEVVHVVDHLNICGTADRHVMVDGRRYIFDLKTGASHVRWGGLEFSVQLTIYSRATSLYDFGSDKHLPMPEVDQERAIICHLPAKGSGQDCKLYWLDLRPDLLDLALQVRKARNAKVLTEFDVPEVTNGEQVVAPEHRRARLVQGLRPLKDADKDAFVATWRRDLADVPFPNQADAWTQAQMDRVEAAFELPWTDEPQTTVAPVLQMPERAPEVAQEDHGGLVDSETLSELRARINKLPRGAKGWMLAWNDDAVTSGEGWRMGRGAHVSLRSYMTSLAGYWLARLAHDSDADDPQDDARLVLASVMGDAALMPTISVGRCLAALTLDEASLCQSIAQAAVEGAVRVNDAGLLEVAA